MKGNTSEIISGVIVPYVDYADEFPLCISVFFNDDYYVHFSSRGAGRFALNCQPDCVNCDEETHFLDVNQSEAVPFTFEIHGTSGIMTPHVGNQVWFNGDDNCLPDEWDFVFYQQLPSYNGNEVVACTDDGHLGHFLCTDDTLWKNCTAVEYLPVDECFYDGAGFMEYSYDQSQSYYLTCGDAVGPLRQPAIGYDSFNFQECSELNFGGSLRIDFYRDDEVCFYIPFLNETFNFRDDGTIDAFCSGNTGQCPEVSCGYSFNVDQQPDCTNSGQWTIYGEIPYSPQTTEASDSTIMSSDTVVETNPTNAETNSGNNTLDTTEETDESETSEASEEGTEPSSAYSLCALSLLPILILG